MPAPQSSNTIGDNLLGLNFNLTSNMTPFSRPLAFGVHPLSNQGECLNIFREIVILCNFSLIILF